MTHLKKELFLGIVVLFSLLVIASFGISAPNPCHLKFTDMVGGEFDDYAEIDLDDYVKVKFAEDSGCEEYKSGNSNIYVRRKSDDSLVAILKHNSLWQALESGEFYLYSDLIDLTTLSGNEIIVSETERDDYFENLEILSPACGYSQNFATSSTINLQVKFTDRDDLITGFYYEIGGSAIEINNSNSSILDITHTFTSEGEKSLVFEVSDQRGNTKKLKTNIILYGSLLPMNYLAACIDSNLDNSVSGSMLTIDGSSSVGLSVSAGGYPKIPIPAENITFNWTFSDGMNIIKTKAQGGDVVYRKFVLGDIGSEFWVKLDLTTDWIAGTIPEPI